MGLELRIEASHAVSCSSGKAVTPLRMRPTMNMESQKRVEARSWSLFCSGEGIRSNGSLCAVVMSGDAGDESRCNKAKRRRKILDTW